MPFPVAALSTSQYDKLRGTASLNPTYAAAQYISLCPNNNVYTAQVNGTPSGQSIAQVTYDGGSGTLANVRPGMTVLISRSNNRRAAYFTGRIRKAPTSTILYINETSAPIADNDYIFVLDDFRLFDKLARISGTVQYKDYDLTYRALRPVIVNLQHSYCGWISNPADSSTKFRVAFNVTGSYAAASGATISAYSWSLPATATVVSGSTNSAAVTVDFATSAGDWVHLTVTDSNGNTTTRHVFIHAASDSYPPLLAADHLAYQVSVSGGISASIEAFSGIDNLLDNTLLVAWDQEYYNGAEGSILTPVKFIGRLRQASAISQTDENYSLIQTARYTVEGVSEQLARIENLPRALLPSTTAPSIWDTIQNLTPWRAIVYLLSEHSTYCELYDLSFDDVSDTFQIPQVAVQGANLYEAVRDLASSINAVFEFAPQGEARVVRDAAYLSASARNSLLIIASFTSQDWLHLEIINDPITNVGSVPASGAFYNTATGIETPLLALAPGVAQEIGANQVALTRQYLASNVDQATAQQELNERAGHHFARNNARDTVTLRVTFPDGYNFLVPSAHAWYTWTIAASDNVLGWSYDSSTRWLLMSLAVDHDNATGTKNVTGEFLIETSGPAGQAIQYPTPTQIDSYLPDLPAFGPYDLAFPELPSLWLSDSASNVDVPPQIMGSDTLTFGGDLLIAWSSAFIKFLKGFLLPTVLARDVTPGAATLGGMSVMQCAVDPFYAKAPNTLPVYALLSDGTNSKVGYNADVAASGAEAGASASSWQAGASLVGAYKTLRASGTQNDILIYAPSTASGGGPPPWQVTFDFAVSQAGWQTGVAGEMTAPLPGTYVPGVGWASQDWSSGAMNGLGIRIDFGNSISIYRVDIHWSVGANISAGDGSRRYEFLVSSNGGSSWSHLAYPDAYSAGTPPASGEHTDVNNLGSDSGTFSSLLFEVNYSYSGSPPPYATSYIYSITLYGHSDSPVLPSAAFVAHSSNRGTGWDAPMTLGSTPGFTGGFDVQRSGGNSFAAADQKIMRATTLGGAYSNYYSITGGVQAVCIIVPWRTWAGADNTSNTNPDIIAAFNGADGSGRTLIWIEGGATPGTVHDITPTAGIVFDNANCVTASFEHHIAVFGKVGGVYKLYVTTNRGSTWTFIENLTSPTFIRCRRYDNSGAVSGTNKGQLYLCESGQNVIDYSSQWGNGGLSPKDPHLTTPLGFDTVF